MTTPADKCESRDTVARQFGTSALGEMTAFTLAIGAVYASGHVFPRQTKALISHLAESLGKWRGAHAETQTGLAKKIIDVGIMNMAGASGMAIQFGLRRWQQPPEEKTPFWYEAGRLAIGRIGGTITALGALTFMGTKAPGMLKNLEGGIAQGIGAGSQSERFAELFASNAIQSAGAIMGNAPAQLLYDCVVNPPQKSRGK
jgi:hypothetical protein